MARLFLINEPTTWEEIEQVPAAEATRCEEAAREEREALNKNEMWILTKLLLGKKAIGCKWVFEVKQGGKGEVEFTSCEMVPAEV